MPDISVPISTSTFIGLVDFLREKNSSRDPIEVIGSALDYWMDNADWKDEILSPPPLVGAATGYSWKSLFLPSGTTLRIRYDGTYFYARVEGDTLMYQQNPVKSPNQFALKVTGGARDAWRDVWVKRPSDKDYVVANFLRANKPETGQ
ncbi:hypothetical protein [Sphingomonas sp.]|uniref:hypothetical protein n=1 Tax=Sphingomonas sp. TaxID=28214 RepID=UPI00260146AB|nr:hypothetical protein [Sphingomonas sp.]